MKHITSVYHFGKRHINTDARFLIVVCIIFVLLRLPSLIEPAWYGDEGIYQVVGSALREGRILYKDIWDHKPPLLYVIYAIANSDLYYVKLLSLLTGLASIFPFFKLARALFRTKKAYYLATGIYVIGLGSPLIEGNIANAENFMMLPIVLGFYTFLRYITTRKIKYIVISGLMFSISCLLKAVSIFDVATIFLLLLFINLGVVAPRISLITLKRSSVFKNITIRFRITVPFLLAFSILPLITLLYFFFHHAMSYFIESVLSDNVGYVSYENVLFFPMGAIVLKVVLLGIVVGALIYWRQRIGFVGFFILLWMSLSMFNTFFSQRPYTHYLIVLLPSFSLYIGYLFIKQWNTIAKLVILFVTWMIITTAFSFYHQNVAYYINYLAFVMNVKSVNSYESFFDNKTPSYYAIAEFVKTHTRKNDNIFFWGESGQIYELSGKLPPGRFIVSYHIMSTPANIIATKQALQKANPKYIISNKPSPDLEQFSEGYKLKYTIDGTDIYEREL
jgi:hypothetical protein